MRMDASTLSPAAGPFRSLDSLNAYLQTTTAAPGPDPVRSRRHASALPPDAHAVIRPAERSAMSSGRGNARGWILTFRPRSRSVPDPLMGWTVGADTLQQVRLRFPTAEAAVRYCRRQGLAFEIHGGTGDAPTGDAPDAMAAPMTPANDIEPPAPAEWRAPEPPLAA